MIPLKDTVHSRSFPLVNWTLIVVNVLVFLWMAGGRAVAGTAPRGLDPESAGAQASQRGGR